VKRILSLDGGGICGVFSLQVLKRIEQILREQRGRAGLVLREEFDFFAGTSTGAIIAAGLAWGMSVGDIERFFVEQGKAMFTKASWRGRWRAWYRSEPLADLFRRQFVEDDAARTPATLGTRRLWEGTQLKYLLVVMRNASTGAAWPICNNPTALYNDPQRPDSNLQIPIWQLLRASTAAPTYFAPEEITMDRQTHVFIDGGITPFNNPALIAVLTATLPCYRIEWPSGVDRLMVVSIGTGYERVRVLKTDVRRISILDQAEYVPPALLSSISQEQDLMCRVLGDCRFGAPLDSEIGSLTGPGLLGAGEKKFAYVRYDRFFPTEETAAMTRRTGQRFTLDNVGLIPYLQEVGAEYATASVRREHLLD
jgi:patatin-like phospholipase/acyl hydrolase